MTDAHPPMHPDRYARAELLPILEHLWGLFTGNPNVRIGANTCIDQQMTDDDFQEVDFGEYLGMLERDLGFRFRKGSVERHFGFVKKMSKNDWEERLAPQFTFGRLADLVAFHAVPIRVRALDILGNNCKPAGAFVAVQQIVERLDPVVDRFGPSTRIDDVLSSGTQMHDLWRRANYASGWKLPRLSGDASLACAELCGLSFGAYTLPYALIRIFLLESSGWSLFWSFPSGIALLMIFFAIKDRFDKPLPPEIRTFRDLALAMVGARTANQANPTL